MLPVAEHEKRRLLEIARHCVCAAAGRGRPLEVRSLAGRLAEPAGCFVTLHQCGHLRGCIGQIETAEPLATVVARCAASAAREDPRFDPIVPAELDGLQIEISVLSPPRRISAQEVCVGLHGLVISRGHHRGVLLPQVAVRYNWPAQRFLEETCLKGGLDRQDWRDPETIIQAFTAEVFSDRDLAVSKPANGSAAYSSST